MSTPRPFVHLHGHTIYSMSDALSDPIELAKRAKEFGMTALAVTDHRVGYGLLDVYLACKRAGVKPILGAELNEVIIEGRGLSAAERRERGIRSYHLPVLAMDFEGYQNLCRILSDAATDGLFRGPNGPMEEACLDIIYKNGWGKRIIALTGCLSSRMAHILLADEDPDRMAKAREWLETLQSVFEEVYIELQFHSHPDQQRLNLLLLKLHKETGVPVVATRDYHYILPTDGAIHDVYVACASGWREGYDSHDYWFTDQETMYRWVDEHEDYKAMCEELGIDPYLPLRTTQEIADRINIEIPTGKSLMPRFPVPEPHTEATYLRKLCVEALAEYARRMEERGTPIYLPEYISRLEWELQVICDRGNAGYMLILWDIINWCHENGVITGPGRGSAAGSLVAFLLGITKLDPIEHGLLFQRFLSPDRADEPDIDTDIADVHRSRVIEYVANRWGREYVAQIGNHNSMSVKAATQALGKALGLNPQQVVAITKPLPAKWPDQTDLTFQKLKEVVKDDPDPAIIGDLNDDDLHRMRELAQEYWSQVNAVEGLADAIARVEGAKKSIGIHAGGVAICPRPITDLVPVTNVPDSAVVSVTQYDMAGLSELGILKMDLLGLRTLSVIDTCLRLIEETEGKRVDLQSIPLNDPKVYRIYSEGRTHGVFQANGKACQMVARAMKPSNFAELTDLLALARPGPMEAEVAPGVTLVDQYILNKQKLFYGEPIEYPHPSLREILEPTKGVWVYQEQIMKAGEVIAGFPPGAQDSYLRKGIAKKKKEIIECTRFLFIYGSQDAVPKIEEYIRHLSEAGVKTEPYEKVLDEIRTLGNTIPGGLKMGYDEDFLNRLYDQFVAFAGLGMGGAAYGRTK